MSPIVRLWTGCLALGAGLVHLALVAGSPPPVAIVLVAVGAAELAWGVACFARGTPPLPRIAIAGALAPVILWVAALLVGRAASAAPVTAALRPLPLATATLFDLAVAVVVLVWLRRGAPPARPDPRPARFLVGVAAGAAVVAVLAAPALAATRAGDAAPPHHFDFGHTH